MPKAPLGKSLCNLEALINYMFIIIELSVEIIPKYFDTAAFSRNIPSNSVQSVQQYFRITSAVQ